MEEEEEEVMVEEECEELVVISTEEAGSGAGEVRAEDSGGVTVEVTHQEQDTMAGEVEEVRDKVVELLEAGEESMVEVEEEDTDTRESPSKGMKLINCRQNT